ncbi:Na(+)-translocating NADH-quinone reductase subunit C [Bacterioplanes sanyensis]|uniref:Na(+)-translocating NADH-quinone reductase subunit C n=1 Tax=Bacterioplanes sanyensis TaxID=1249553 RepID=A0A222FLG0_9GAMM|nr:Na(+)-translocating NADH-quinone reductase subunit C [Bacterioplanes sanyensis]ASP39354.1 Na(+)-translocating NADH-quinone reductase subunit C [Bacterioplanes sanyensis]
MSANNDSIQKTLIVAVLLCLVCSVIVASAAVSLKPLQQANKTEDMKKNILAAAGLLDDSLSITEQFKQVTTRIVNLEEGRFANDAEIEEIKQLMGLTDISKFDQRKASQMPELSSKLAGSEDPASIKRRSKFASVYMVERGDSLEKLILPVHGYGLWSTLYGFIALKGDLETVEGLGFYSHGETPGLGGEVDNPLWKGKWVGKQLYNEQGQLAIEVVKGEAPQGSEHKVDGLSGATLTSRGVNNLVRYWVGEQAFGKLLHQMKSQGA